MFFWQVTEPPHFNAGDGESGAALPVADAASRFQGSVPMAAPNGCGHRLTRRGLHSRGAHERSLRPSISAGLCFLARLARGAQRRDTHACTKTCPNVKKPTRRGFGFLRVSILTNATVHRTVAPSLDTFQACEAGVRFEPPYFKAGDGESGAAPPVADAASRFQGGTPSGGHECGRRTAGATRAQPSRPRKKSPPDWVVIFGAGDEARTRYLDLGKVALYQMSYARKRKIDYSA